MQSVSFFRRSFNPLNNLLLIFVFMVAGCSVKLIADYDSATLEQILSTGKKVDLFYGKLLETPEKERSYSKYSNQYVEIEVDVRDIVSRNKARELNKESTRISEIILKQW